MQNPGPPLEVVGNSQRPGREWQPSPELFIKERRGPRPLCCSLTGFPDAHPGWVGAGAGNPAKSGIYSNQANSHVASWERAGNLRSFLGLSAQADQALAAPGIADARVLREGILCGPTLSPLTQPSFRFPGGGLVLVAEPRKGLCAPIREPQRSRRVSPRQTLTGPF